jgi:hypothetical protein
MAPSDPSPDGGEREVFAGLPNARPHRRSAKRDRPEAKTKATATAPAQPKAKAKPKAKAAATPRPATSKIPPAGYATPRSDDDALRGADLVTTTVRAAGELAHIGIAAGGRAIKSAFQRLPRP